MRKLFVAGNWKMYTNGESAKQLASAIVQGVADESRITIAVCPPFPYLSRVAGVVSGSRVFLGGQNFYPAKEGAFTGEVSPAMLMEVGCTYAIVGHSERRHVLHETNDFINLKVHSAIDAGLQPIFCIGETLAERDGNQTELVLTNQLTHGLAGLTADKFARAVIAYEPFWAIGTGRNATPEQAQQAHQFIRRRIGEMFGEKSAQSVLIQYGGSVKPENAASLMAQQDVDGALVGGASLKADQFLAVIRAGLALGKC